MSSREQAFIMALRQIAGDPAARNLSDDAAILARPTGDLVLSHDMIVENVHYLSNDPPETVAQKLVGVNLSDLAAKGAKPLGALMGYSLGIDYKWDQAFVKGLASACHQYNLPLLGGDTVALPRHTAHFSGMTVIGLAPSCGAPDRRGAKAEDDLWVTGPIGDAGFGLRILNRRKPIDNPLTEILIQAYRCPVPRLEEGAWLAPYVHAMADISDGLLIDAKRIAEASNLGVKVNLDKMPLSKEAIAYFGDSPTTRLQAATAGDDYQLILSAPSSCRHKLQHLADEKNFGLFRVGKFSQEKGLSLYNQHGLITPPSNLGYEHGCNC
ncbi:MAG: thiamine-phosphate kinase [Zymomonas mobilis subsp. pomaceae]|uniref:Thiamine-monophosphate kinase n=1 Tax=Zymomonas mobilis subsp. pomaceae (strain ATCC 29192 / DSM 22645 / JCM 10191 / CCUG 17912 / NBRC 13757 / NCIMB 11200 / NRRL B-4491 / Barker I) TaxID=579138 RepID=F8EW34_ZYMMT|nr:thiamine-phosphate kinase [Zymomonas mobilis]AEI38444.1 thiamine-monophosphate kinase [Zymomonas mobilis subsp. pomaceae ATCC 29192]MDX5948133.1 thiamine-phosphate kinase [Zymomonas mobilis subsp. pomaceae]GEB89756.1 thiamine-monophosphate kinase [Zymomonas mobilis subsp. pomaceae]